MPPGRLIYAIFEGGGARGVTHLGAVAGVENEEFVFAGVAGASAGAFVAALIAAGYGSAELLSPQSGTNLLAKRGLTPLDLLGRDAWCRYKRVERNLRWLRNALLSMGLLGAFISTLRTLLILNAARKGLARLIQRHSSDSLAGVA